MGSEIQRMRAALKAKHAEEARLLECQYSQQELSESLGESSHTLSQHSDLRRSVTDDNGTRKRPTPPDYSSDPPATQRRSRKRPAADKTPERESPPRRFRREKRVASDNSNNDSVSPKNPPSHDQTGKDKSKSARHPPPVHSKRGKPLEHAETEVKDKSKPPPKFPSRSALKSSSKLHPDPSTAQASHAKTQLPPPPPPPSSSAKATRHLEQEFDLEFDLKVNSPQFRSDLNKRMGIPEGNGKESAQIKRERRQWVLEECLKRGMDLRSSFTSWPYETRMYPYIKAITLAAPQEWKWTRVTTRDVIRTLCWDRVRSVNRRKPMKPKATRDIPRQKKRPPQNATTRSTMNETKSKPPVPVLDDSDDDLQDPLPKAPKTISRLKIPDIATDARHPRALNDMMPKPTHTQTKAARKLQVTTSPVEPYHPYEEDSSPLSGASQYAQIRSNIPSPSLPSPKLPSEAETAALDEVFEVEIGKKTYLFAKDIEYQEFDNDVESVLTVEESQIRCYRPCSGTKAARKWKPIEDSNQFESMLASCADVGVEVRALEQSYYFESGTESESDSDLRNIPDMVNGGQERGLDGSRDKSSTGLTSPPISQLSDITQSKKNKAIAPIAGDVVQHKSVLSPSKERRHPKKATAAPIAAKPCATKPRVQRKPPAPRPPPNKALTTKASTSGQEPASKNIKATDDPPPARRKRGRPRKEKPTEVQVPETRVSARATTTETDETVESEVGDSGEQQQEGEHLGEKKQGEESDGGTSGNDREGEEHENINAKGTRTRSGRLVRKSRIILEEEDYRRDVAHADELALARRQLKQSWNTFEANFPPSYLPYLKTNRTGSGRYVEM